MPYASSAAPGGTFIHPHLLWMALIYKMFYHLFSIAQAWEKFRSLTRFMPLGRSSFNPKDVDKNLGLDQSLWNLLIDLLLDKIYSLEKVNKLVAAS